MNRLSFILFLSFAFTATLLVPEEYSTIQSAIDASSGGDTILVSAGTYYDNINFNGKNIMVQGEDRETTIIDGNQNGTVVTFESGEDSTAVLSGFTIMNGNSVSGGGISCTYSAPTIDNLIIFNNHVSNNGGAIFINHSVNPLISNCFISENSSNEGGGGLSIFNSSPNIVNTEIRNNQSSSDGGGIRWFASTPTLTNVVIAENSSNRGGGVSCWDFSNSLISNVVMYDNTASVNGGALFIRNGSHPLLTNSILWDNYPQQVSFDNSFSINEITIKYTDFQGGIGSIIGSNGNINYLEGNIDEDPQFNDDYTLQPTSPCIDAGDPNSELDPDGTRADMGAYYYHQEPEVLGCIDELACNYNSDANINDNSCDYSCHDNGDYSLSFDGDDMVELNHPGPINNSSRTISFSLKIDNLDESSGILNYGNNEIGAYEERIEISVNTDGDLIVDNNGGWAKFDNIVTDSQFHDYFLVLSEGGDLTDFVLYKDSQMYNINSYDGGRYNINTSNQPITIGRNGQPPPWQWYLNGSINNLKIWDTALSQADIQIIINSDYDDNLNSSISYFKFNSGTGDILYDYSGNQNHGTIYGAEWVENPILGDLNNDGILNILDVISVVNIVVGNSSFDDSADFTGDGQVNILDIIFIVQLVINS